MEPKGLASESRPVMMMSICDYMLLHCCCDKHTSDCEFGSAGHEPSKGPSRRWWPGDRPRSAPGLFAPVSGVVIKKKNDRAILSSKLLRRFIYNVYITTHDRRIVDLQKM